MITTIKDFKIMLETVGHMGFTPEMPVSNIENNNEESDYVTDTLNSTLEMTESILKYVQDNQTNFDSLYHDIMNLTKKYNHPFPEYIEQKLQDIKQNNGLLTLLDVEWFADIDNEDLMDHNEYSQFAQDITDNVRLIKKYL